MSPTVRAGSPRQDRWTCPRGCGAAGWWTPSTHIGARPLDEHQCHDGSQCASAAIERDKAVRS